MDNQTLWTELTSVFREVMDNPEIAIAETTTAKAIPEWDSITHVMLMVAVEKRFRVKFTAAEIQALRDVGQLAALIRQKAS